MSLFRKRKKSIMDDTEILRVIDDFAVDSMIDNVLEEGKGGFELKEKGWKHISARQYDKAFLCFEKLALSESGHSAYGQAMIGIMYIRGQGIERDWQKGAQFAAKASYVTIGEVPELVDAAAHELCDLALLYSEKKNDNVTALKCLEESAALGYDTAFAHMAMIYLAGGKGIERDVDRAMELLRESAMKEDVMGMVLLAMSYLKGIGVGESTEKAKILLTRAAEKGSDDAKEMLKRL